MKQTLILIQYAENGVWLIKPDGKQATKKEIRAYINELKVCFKQKVRVKVSYDV